MIRPASVSHVADFDLNIVANLRSSLELFLIWATWFLVFLIGLLIIGALCPTFFIILVEQSA